jgi:hypothetical protein
VAQVVELLPNKSKIPSSNPSASQKKKKKRENRNRQQHKRDKQQVISSTQEVQIREKPLI